MKTTRICAPILSGLLAFAIGACSEDSDPGTPAPAGAGGAAGSTGAAGSGTAGKAGSGGTAGSDTAGAAGTGGAAGKADDGGSSEGSGTGGAAPGDGAPGDSAPIDGARGDGPTLVAKSDGTWVVYAEPYGDGGAMNPISATIMGTISAFSGAGGRMRVALLVTGLPANRTFGSHIHRLKCDDNKAGGHYQDMPFPDGGSASDPMYANPTNEVWLDFTTDAAGTAMSTATVDWLPRAGQASAVVIHDMKTGDGGIAGAKLACTNMAF